MSEQLVFNTLACMKNIITINAQIKAAYMKNLTFLSTPVKEIHVNDGCKISVILFSFGAHNYKHIKYCTS